MPMPKKRKPARKPNERAPLSHSVIAATRKEAERLVANRDRRDQLERLAVALTEAINLMRALYTEEIQREVYDPTQIDLRRLGRNALAYVEVKTKVFDLWLELAPYRPDQRGSDGWRDCALPGRSVDDEQERLLAERGASSYQVGAMRDAADGATRKRVDRLKRERPSQMRRNIQSMPHGRGDIVVPVNGQFELLIKGPQPWESWIADEEKKVTLLSADRRGSSKRRGRTATR